MPELNDKRKKLLQQIDALKKIGNTNTKQTPFVNNGFSNILSDLFDIQNSLADNRKKHLKYIIDAVKETNFQLPNIFISNLQNVFFASDGFCDSNLSLGITELEITPKEIDFFDQLRISPNNVLGGFFYENEEDEKQRVNYNLHDVFTNDNFIFETINNGELFKTTWLNGTQTYQISDLDPTLKINNFINAYYNNVSFINFKEAVANIFLLTNNNFGNNRGLIKAFSFLDNFFGKILSICNTPNADDNIAIQNIDVNIDEIENIFVFDDETQLIERFAQTLNFIDCETIKYPTTTENLEDFIFQLSESSPENALELMVDRLTQDVNDFNDDGDNKNTLTTLLRNINLNAVKSLIMGILSPKMILPIVILLKAKFGAIITNLNDVLKKVAKFFFKVIKDIIYVFVRVLLRFIVNDLFILVKKLIRRILLKKRKKYLLIINGLLAIFKQNNISSVNSCESAIQFGLNAINQALNTNQRRRIPPFLLAFSNRLSGYNTERAYINILQKLEENGISTEPLYGETNLFNTSILAIINGIDEEEATNGFISGSNQQFVLPSAAGPIVVPPGLISIFGKKE